MWLAWVIHPKSSVIAAYGKICSMTWDEDIDAIGLLCPLPVLRLRKRLQNMQIGQLVRLRASDPASILDVPHFCNQTGNVLVAVEEGLENAVSFQCFLIRKA